MSTFGQCEGGGGRSAARMSMPLIAVVTTMKESHSAVLVDLSATGAKLRGSGLPAISEELFVTIESVIAFGVVTWATETERGIVFDEPLRAADVARLRQKVAKARGLPPELTAALDDWALGFAR